MAHWTMEQVVTVLAGLTVVLLGGVYMLHFLLGSGSRKSAAHTRNMRTTWKVVKLSGPLPEGLDGKVEYGVIISSDEMLAQTQTMLVCPLISGVDSLSKGPLAIMPWHVEVKLGQNPQKHYAEIDYGRKYVSTKIILPVSHDEVDMDGRERGYLDEDSRTAVAKKLSLWLPPFAKLALPRLI